MDGVRCKFEKASGMEQYTVWAKGQVLGPTRMLVEVTVEAV